MVKIPFTDADANGIFNRGNDPRKDWCNCSRCSSTGRSEWQREWHLYLIHLKYSTRQRRWTSVCGWRRCKTGARRRQMLQRQLRSSTMCGIWLTISRFLGQLQTNGDLPPSDTTTSKRVTHDNNEERNEATEQQLSDEKVSCFHPHLAPHFNNTNCNQIRNWQTNK